MTAYYIVLLLCFLAVTAALFVRYVNITVDREFRNLARAATDEEYRKEELKKLDRRLAPENTPAGVGLATLPGPARGAGRLLPPALMAIGVILLWGGVFAKPSERGRWRWSGGAAVAASAIAMLATLRKRRLERHARLLRARSDLRRLDGDYPGSAGDLNALLKMTPWDDAAWAELGDALKETGEKKEALACYRRAYSLDPAYRDYYVDAAGLALDEKMAPEAEAVLDDWSGNIRDPGPAAEARHAAYRAALALLKGDREEGMRLCAKAADLDKETLSAAIDLDPALERLRDIERTL